MPRRCAVPYCNTGRKADKVKVSFFRVPNDNVLRNKWENAIPGVIQMERSQVICEKHFNESDIAHEWIKRDSNGQIIAQVAYKVPHLKKDAVPSKFDFLNKEETDISFHNYAKRESDRTSPPAKNSAVPSMDSLDVEDDNDSCARSPCSTQSPMHEALLHDQPVNVEVASKNSHVTRAAEPSKFSFRKNENDDGLFHNYAKSASRHCIALTKKNALSSVDSSNAQSCSAESRSFTKSLTKSSTLNTLDKKSLEKTNISCIALLRPEKAPSLEPMDQSNCDPDVLDSVVSFNSYKVASSVTIDKPNQKSAVITIPATWGAIELEKGQRVHFSHAIMRLEDGIRCPVIVKGVTLDLKRTLRYYVHGRLIDVAATSLVEFLNEDGILPDILRRFERMNVCSGLGDVNTYLIPAGGAYQDYLQQWRSKDCFLICAKRRCGYCAKSRKNIQQQAVRLENRTMIRRIRDVSNPIDQCKLEAMRLRNKRDRKLKLRLKKRVNHLMMCINEQNAKIASMHNMTC